MQSKERVLRSLDFKKADRIARFDSYWPEFAELCKKELKLPKAMALEDYFGIDIAIIVPDETPYPGMKEVISMSDDEAVLRNGYGVVERTKKGGFFSEEMEYLIKEPKDLDRYPFEDPRLDTRYENFIEQVWKEKAKGRCVFGKIGGPYIRSTFIRGQVNFLMDIAGDEGFARELASRVGDFLVEIGKEQIKRADLYDTGIWIYDDMAYNHGPMMSPRAFERIFYPIYKKMVRELKEAGANKVGLHSDGDIRPILDMLIDAGIDLINPVEPKAGMSVKELKKKYGNRLAYVGGMCNADVLVNGPKERIIRQTMEIIEAARDGGVIIGAHSIGPDIPVENYLAYIQCVEENGYFINS